MRIDIRRLLAAVLMGILYALYVHSYYDGWRKLGKDAFMVHEASRFDAFMLSSSYAHLTLITYALLAICFLIVYEVVAIGFSYLLKARGQGVTKEDSV